jgi:CRP/FNR family transcriptional regulator, anaerobic regulatory protein
MEELIALLKLVGPMSGRLEKRLRVKIRPYYFKKGEYLLRAGEVSGHILFIKKGLVRSYSLLEGIDVSNWFMKEGHIIISVVSFFNQLPALDSIVALEDCECWGITFEELQETYTLHPMFNVTGRLITEKYYGISEARERSLRRRTPDEKYAYMMTTDSDLVNRVLHKYMASFLDVGVRTYAAIRKRYAEKKRRPKR